MVINEIFEKCTKLTMSKRHDYTSSLDNHENFKRAAMIAGWFVSDEDKPYVVLIGTKLTRLASLLVPGKVPNNESIEDTFLDLINYCALWMERRTHSMTILYGCKQCGSDYNHQPLTISIPGIPAHTFYFCSPKCRDLWSVANQ